MVGRIEEKGSSVHSSVDSVTWHKITIETKSTTLTENWFSLCHLKIWHKINDWASPLEFFEIDMGQTYKNVVRERKKRS